MKNSKPGNLRRATEQAEAARILVGLTTQQLDAKLPAASWHISAFGTELSGNVTALEYDRDHNLYCDDETSIKNVQAWGRSLGIEPEYREWLTQPGTSEISITTEEHGIKVNIWACITTRQAPSTTTIRNP